LKEHSKAKGELIKKLSKKKVDKIQRSAANAVTDANASRVKIDTDVFPGAPETAFVHDGFYSAYLHVRPQVLAWFETRGVPQGAKVRVCGHSLGGALATLCSLELSLRGYDVELVSWGSPRVGNRAFVEWFREDGRHSRVARFVNDWDPVTKVPPHVTQYPEKTYSHVCAPNWFAPLAVEQMDEKTQALLKTKGVHAAKNVMKVKAQFHLMGNYQKGCRRFFGEECPH